MLKIVTVSMVFMLCAVATAHATDLMDVYQLALKNDPVLQKAVAVRNATMENKPLATSALLPHLSASANYQKRTGNGTSAYFQRGTFVTPQTTTDSTGSGYSIQLNQPLFHWQDWVALGKADMQAAQARIEYEIARQDLIVRTAQAYFNVLAAQDVMQAARANQTALAQQLRQTKKKQAVGLSASTDVQDIQAAFDQARAQTIADRQTLLSAENALMAIVGVHVGDLRSPQTSLPLSKPEPARAQAWIDAAIRNNLKLESARLDAKIAAKTVDIQQAARYPTLDLSLSHNYSTSDDNGSLSGVTQARSSQFTGNSISLQLSWPIYSGGAIAARSRQAKYQHVAAEAQMHLIARQARQQTRDAFLGIQTDISKVKALKASVASAQTALHANKVGLKIGTRTTVDVLTARKNLLTARTKFARARYDYLIAGLLLQQAAGTLGPSDLKKINQYLTQKSSNHDKPDTASSNSALPKSHS